MGMMYDVEWRVRVKVRGESGWWWITAPAGMPPDVTRDVRLAAQVIDPAVAGMLVGALDDRRARRRLGEVLEHEVLRAA